MATPPLPDLRPAPCVGNSRRVLLAKAVMALLREARSLSRRADKLGGVAATVDDPTTQQLATAASTSMEQLVHHLMVLERQVQRGEKAAGRRAR